MNENFADAAAIRLPLAGIAYAFFDEGKIYCSNDVHSSASIFRVMKLLIPWKFYLRVDAIVV